MKKHDKDTNILLNLLSPGITTAEEKFNKVKKELNTNGTIDIPLTNGTKIRGVKSIAKWGTGLFYGFIPDQDNFIKSVSLNEIEFED